MLASASPAPRAKPIRHFEPHTPPWAAEIEQTPLALPRVVSHVPDAQPDDEGALHTTGRDHPTGILRGQYYFELPE